MSEFTTNKPTTDLRRIANSLSAFGVMKSKPSYVTEDDIKRYAHGNIIEAKLIDVVLEKTDDNQYQLSYRTKNK